MQNIALKAALEGTQHEVKTDWFAIKAMLETREMSGLDVQNVYNDLCAGLIVTTRGLTLSKISDDDNGIDAIKDAGDTDDLLIK
ncbi:hypothetical protein ACFOD0_15130 [Shewanella intestini]|uniref:Uncharacterized protein n=1 Tax=Shewanella intestini TaxID=2017544 RepID=A0ABS5I5T1_9GAMM|nr:MULTISPECIES: hypothetical protein [Shewanella]MBR9729390.1 hypothetical protein [Shewanella intestini]MRG37470.1 hypothetical protein [Shewanella sp. XMDDZSB0408]